LIEKRADVVGTGDDGETDLLEGSEVQYFMRRQTIPGLDYPRAYLVVMPGFRRGPMDNITRVSHLVTRFLPVDPRSHEYSPCLEFKSLVISWNPSKVSQPIMKRKE
jgi:hypothetical protein